MVSDAKLGMLIFGVEFCRFLFCCWFVWLIVFEKWTWGYIVFEFCFFVSPPTYSNGQSTLLGVFATDTFISFHNGTERVERFGQIYFSYAYSLNK